MKTGHRLPLPIALAVLAACPTSFHRTNRSAVEAARDVLTPATGEVRRQPSTEELLGEALAGVVENPAEELGSRLQVRELRMPRPAAGGNARFDFDGGKRGWITTMPSPQLLTSPAFAEGRVFIGGGFSSNQFYALAAYTGELDWSVVAPDGGPTAAIVEDRKVIFNTESCTLFVCDAATGRLLWKRWLGDPLMSQPAAAGGLVFSAYPTGGAHEFGAFRLTDGEPVWKIQIPADVIQAPQVHGDSLFFATMDGTAFRVERERGRVVWRRPVGATSALWVDRENVLLARKARGARGPAEQPVVLAAADGRVVHEGEKVDAPYLGGSSRDRQLGAGQSGAWGSVPHGQHLGLQNVAAGWAFQGSSPAVADGRAYFAVGGEVRARDMATGDEVWRIRYAEANGAQAMSPPAVVGAELVFGTVDGHLYSVDIDTGMTLWAYDLGEPIVFQPIVAQGWVYVATGRGHVIGLEMGDATFDGWHMWGGNARHAGLVETAGTVDPRLLQSLERPGQGTMRRVGFEAEAGAEDGSAREDTGAAETEREPELPLAKTVVSGRISGFVARVTVTQQFQNPYERPIEAVYLFPLPADSAVDDMEMHVGDRVVRAKIQKRAQARQTYSEARASGRRAALLEQQRPNLFAQRVANIQPGERIDVRIQYVQALPFEDGGYEYVFPMVAPHRYDPANPDPTRPAPDPLAPTQGQPPAVAAAPPELRRSGDVELSLDVDAGLPIGRIESPTHGIDVSRPGESAAAIRLTSGDGIPNRDFVLRYRVGGAVPRATVLAHRDGDEGYFTLLLQPPETGQELDDAISARDFTFVVDTSSSMKGRPMVHARSVMRRILDGVRPDDSFQVLSFSDRVERLSESPLSGSRENVARAAGFVDSLRATGATEMVPAVEAALDGPAGAPSDRLRIVVLLTDGHIGNEAEVLRAIVTRLGSSRVYALGVGTSPNRFLLERASEVGRGRAIVASPSERPEEVAARFATWVERPVFTDVAVDWGGLEVRDVYPRRLPDLFAGRPVVMHGRYEEGGRATVRIRGTYGGRRMERSIEVDLPANGGEDRHAAQRSLWARAAVKDRMSRLYLRDDPALVEEVTEIGLRHRLVTQWTSFVAVDETPARAADGSGGDPTEVARATLSPSRSLPGDPEVRIPAPEDARAVTVILPFGETLSAEWEPDLGVWSARFLVPSDAEEGTYPVDVAITHADGRLERLRLWYTVDSSAALVRIEVVGEARPGADVVVRATQVLTEADLEQVGWRAGDPRLQTPRAQLLSDARRVEIRGPDGTVVPLGVAGPGVWETTLGIPDDASGVLRLQAFVVDLAANVRTQGFEIRVSR